jgi:hypothetical protein
MLSARLLVVGLTGVCGFVSPAISMFRHDVPAASLALAAAVPLPIETPMHTAVAKLHSAAVEWSLRKLSWLPADDVMLALASPEAFWLLREWRRTTFGAQYALKETLDGTCRQIHALASGSHEVLRGATVSMRSKGLWSTFHKAAVRQKRVHDVLAVRVVLDDEHDEAACYEALHALRARWPSVDGRFKDYVAWPKANGYSGLHDTLLLPSGQPFEVQIRTSRQHAIAEYGTAAHRRYKEGPVQLSAAVLSAITSGLAAKRGHALAPLDQLVAWLALVARFAGKP